MLHKDFFRLLLKLFGLYSLTIVAFVILPQSIPQLLLFESGYASFFILLIIAVPVSLFLFLIFKADKIINWLKLEQGFEEEKLNFGDLNTANLLKLACIVIGGIFIIDSVPDFCMQGYYLFKNSVQHQDNDAKDFYPVGVNALKIFIGYLMLRNYEWVGKLLRVRE